VLGGAVKGTFFTGRARVRTHALGYEVRSTGVEQPFNNRCALAHRQGRKAIADAPRKRMDSVNGSGKAFIAGLSFDICTLQL